MQTDQYIRAARAFVAREQWPAAWDAVNRELNERPDRPEALYLAGCIMRGVGHYGIALGMFAKALAHESKHVNLWMNYAACLHDLSRWDEAREAFSVVHKRLPDDPMPIANIASGYIQQGDNREGINWADRALKLDPKCHIAHISKGFGCLGLGRWRDAWEHNEYLYGNQLTIRLYGSENEPEWDGSHGQTIVVNADQGLGDQIMFAQCLKEMQRDCREVIVECSQRMVRFFVDNFPGITVYGTLKDQDLEWPRHHSIDAHVHISYLGRWYRTRDADFPRTAYIRSAPALLAKWRTWLEQFPRPWVGIAWRGGIAATQQHLRSIDLDQLKPVLEQHATFIDMSYQDSDREVSEWNLNNPLAQIRKPPIDVKNYQDTIALTAALDEVVTVTTTLLHVCGALGKRCFVLVPTIAPWREAYRGCEPGMIWYPKDSVTFFRQKPGEDWTHPINRVARSLAEAISSSEDERAAA